MKYRSPIIWLVTLLVAFAGTTPKAQAWWIAGEGGIRFETDTETNSLKNRTPIGFLVGHQYPLRYEYVFEFSTFSAESGNETLKINRSDYTFLGEFRYHPFALEGFSWYPYIAGLVGGYAETVETTFLGQTREDSGTFNLLGGFGIGVWGNFYRQFRAGAEFRAIFGQDLSPALTPEILLRLGMDL